MFVFWAFTEWQSEHKKGKVESMIINDPTTLVVQIQGNITLLSALGFNFRLVDENHPTNELRPSPPIKNSGSIRPPLSIAPTNKTLQQEPLNQDSPITANWPVSLEKADAMKRSGDYGGAKEILDGLLHQSGQVKKANLRPLAYAFRELANAYCDSGNFDEGKPLLSQAEKLIERATGGLLPENPNRHYSLPEIIHKVEPEFSEGARKIKLTGAKVVLSVDIDNGVPSDIKVVKAAGLGLDEKAVEAVSQWRFAKTVNDCKSIKIRVLVEVTFNLV